MHERELRIMYDELNMYLSLYLKAVKLPIRQGLFHDGLSESWNKYSAALVHVTFPSRKTIN